ncbi:Effector protein sipB [Serratia quinivorans]|uniref:type III secretion system translocon subunit SctE n=1 Tax=Serratia quinivorans TaxID=137545 RepID=UPI00217844EE|nr:type III secretion system translocon subunit SctE [Serratia quinivorans]CAI1903431.1 Effector protein sipB [Serratia quinivorans]
MASQIYNARTVGILPSMGVGDVPAEVNKLSNKMVHILDINMGLLAKDAKANSLYITSSMPQLKSPVSEMEAARTNPSTETTADGSEAKQDNSLASILATIGTLQNLIHGSSLEDMRGRLQLMQEQANKVREQGNAMSGELDAALAKAKESNDLALEAEGALNKAKENLDSLQTKESELNQKLATAQEALEKLQQQKPQTEATKNEIQKLQQAIETYKGKLSETKTGIAKAETEVQKLSSDFTSKAKDATDKLQQANELRNKASSWATANGSQMVLVSNGQGEMNAMSQLALLAGMLSEIIGKSAIEGLREQQKVLESINESNRLSALKKAKEAEEAQRKADEANKAAGCASKILGAIALVISAVVLVATAGAASPLVVGIAALGLAMATTDVILDATGNGSIMQQLSGAISSVVKDILIAQGMDKAEAEKTANIIGMVVGAVIMLALTVGSIAASSSSAATGVAKAAAGALGNAAKGVANAATAAVKSTATLISNAANISKSVGAFGQLVSRIISRIDFSAILKTVFQGMKEAGKAVNSAMSRLGKLIGKTSELRQSRAESFLQGTELATTFTSTTVPSGLKIHSASLALDAKTIEAKVGMLMADMEMISKLQEQISKAVEVTISSLMNVVENINFAASKQRDQIGHMITPKFA